MKRTLLLLVLPAASWAAVLSHGPIIGAVTPVSATIMLRTDAEAQVQVGYARLGDPGLIYSEAVYTSGDSDFAAHIPISGLLPDTWYEYHVFVDGVAQFDRTEKFRTFSDGVETDFAFAAIADHLRKKNWVPVYEKVRKKEPRFLIQLGDFPHGDAKTLQQTRAQYRETLAWRSTRKMLERLPLFHVWDDHDYGNNNANKNWFNKWNSLRAFKEYFPTPPLEQPDLGIWHSFRFAQAEFFMLDVRSQRDRNADPDNSQKSMLDGDESAYSQKTWLLEGLADSTAKWKFLVSPVPFNPTAKPKDGWGAFLTERDQIIDFVAEYDIQNVIVISGDLHMGGRLDDGTNSGDPQRDVWIYEMNVPDSGKATRGSISCTGGICGSWSEGELTRWSGYGWIRVETNPHQVILEIYDWKNNLRGSLVVPDREPW